MKILLILIYILILISGPIGSIDVIGYPGGSVRISCNLKQNGISIKYFCKEKTRQCYRVETHFLWIQKDRVSLYASLGYLAVIYRDLSLEDAGLYQCGETGVRNYTVNLRVKTDPCCSGSKTVIGYPGETATISCSYPEEFLPYNKYFYKLDGHTFRSVIDTAVPQTGRFSISEDRGFRVVSVRISDVREDDKGVYYCGVGEGQEPVSFETFFQKIHLWVSGSFKDSTETPRLRSTIQPTAVTYRRTPAAPAVIISAEEPPTPGSSKIIIIITVSICVVLLLIGGLILIFYKLRCSRTQDSPITRRRSGTNDIVYENDLPGNQNNIKMGPIYQNLVPNTNQSDSVYQSLDLRSRDQNSIYHTLNPNTNQIQSTRT